MEIRDYARLLRRIWPMLIVLAVLGAVAGGAAGALRTPQYESTARAFVSVRSADSLSDLSSGAAYTQQAVASYADIATTAYVLKPVIAKLHLGTTPAELASAVTVTTADSTAVLSVAVQDGDAKRAATIANAITAQLSTAVVALTPDGASAASKKSVKLTSVDPAIPSTTKLGTGTPLLAIGGGVVGLVIAIALGLVRELADTRVRDKDEFARIADAPLLGVTVKNPMAARRPLVVRDMPRTAEAEAYRTIRTNLRFVELDEDAKSIVVTSSVEGEGKSTTAANLAAAVARLGQRVLLVDADLRRPQVASLFDIDGSIGLTDVLLGDVTLEQAVQTTGIRDLDLLPAGTVPPNPNEQLQSKAMTALVERLHGEYDLVIFDTPPLLAVSDAAVLSVLTGGALLVGATGTVRRGQVAAALEALDRVDARLLGTVMTMAPRRSITGYGYGYGVAAAPKGVPVMNKPVPVLRAQRGGVR